jgi:hypothetical protein
MATVDGFRLEAVAVKDLDDRVGDDRLVIHYEDTGAKRGLIGGFAGLQGGRQRVVGRIREQEAEGHSKSLAWLGYPGAAKTLTRPEVFRERDSLALLLMLRAFPLDILSSCLMSRNVIFGHKSFVWQGSQ